MEQLDDDLESVRSGGLSKVKAVDGGQVGQPPTLFSQSASALQPFPAIDDYVIHPAMTSVG
jgi:hypothetical protein